MDRVDEPFQLFFCTQRMASYSGRYMQQSSLSLSSSYLISVMSCLAQVPESIPIFAHPPTPSATTKMFLDTQRASSPPFHTFSWCGADPQAILNSKQPFSQALAYPLKIFLRSSFAILMNQIINLFMNFIGLAVIFFLTTAVQAVGSTYIITEEFTTSHFTDNDINLWSPFGATIPLMKFTQCSGSRIIGGYKVFSGDSTNPNGITRTFTGLVPHHSVRVRGNLYKIDSWPNNTFFIQADGGTVQTYTFNSTNPGTSDICGEPTPITNSIDTSFNDHITSIDVSFTHTATTLTLRMLSNLVGTSGAWGLRDLSVTMEACDESCLACTNSSACRTCDTGNGFSMSGPYCDCTNAAHIRQKYIPCSAAPCAMCLTALPCSTGFYNSGITGDCQPCHIGCSACTSPANTAVTCSACSTSFIGTPPTTACFSCYSGCASCTSTALNACTACNHGYFFDSTTNTCGTSCPSNMYGQESNRQCYTCTSPCMTCNGNNGGSYYCLSCVTNRYLYDYTCYTTCPHGMVGYNGQCIATCPQTTYADTGTSVCLNCGSNCLECSSSTVCIICATNAYEMAGVCYLVCPVNYYGNNSTMFCMTCHSSCLTCNGPFMNDCTACPASTILVGTTCYTSCPQSTFGGLCESCHSTCLTCSGSSQTQCTSCAQPDFYHLNQSTCLDTCHKGDLSNNYNFTCQQCDSGKVASYGQCVDCHPSCLTCSGPSFLECSSCDSQNSLVGTACVLGSQNTVVNGNSGLSGSSAIAVIFLVHFLLAVLLEMVFQYKTNILTTIQLIQILSYTRYLTVELSESTQRLANLFYYTNFAFLLDMVNSQPHHNLPPLFRVQGKSGVFIDDSMGVQVIMLVCVLGFIGLRYLSSRASCCKWLYNKCNPYLITYTFRLVLLELSLDAFLYIYCFDVSTATGVLSLVFLLIDIILVVASGLWRIRTREDGSQVAIFYNNQIGQPHEQQSPSNTAYSNISTIQHKIKHKKILPHMVQILLKVPIPICLLLYVGNHRTQTICWFISFGFYLLFFCVIPYRRRVYRYTVRFNAIVLLLNAMLGLIVGETGGGSEGMVVIWGMAVTVLLALTLLQALVNYEFIVDATSGAVKKCCEDDENTSRNQESQSNLTQNIVQQQQRSPPKRDTLMKVEQVSQPSVIFDKGTTHYPTRDLDYISSQMGSQPQLDIGLQ